jgi:hypothetical protein
MHAARLAARSPFHNTETLCRQVPRDLDIVRFYLTEYPATLGQKPQARSAFIRS